MEKVSVPAELRTMFHTVLVCWSKYRDYLQNYNQKQQKNVSYRKYILLNKTIIIVF